MNPDLTHEPDRGCVDRPAAARQLPGDVTTGLNGAVHKQHSGNSLHEPDRGCVDRPAAARQLPGDVTTGLNGAVHKQHSGNSNPDPPVDIPGLDTVVAAVAHFYRIPSALVLGTHRDRKAAWPRQVAMTLCCEFFPHLPCTTISRAFRRTHSTLVYARRCVLAAQKQPHTRADLTRLRKLIQLKLSRPDEPCDASYRPSMNSP